MGQCVPETTPTGVGNPDGGSANGEGGTGEGGTGDGGASAPGCGCAQPARQRGGTTGAFVLVLVFGLGARRWRITMER